MLQKQAWAKCSSRPSMERKTQHTHQSEVDPHQTKVCCCGQRSSYHEEGHYGTQVLSLDAISRSSLDHAPMQWMSQAKRHQLAHNMLVSFPTRLLFSGTVASRASAWERQRPLPKLQPLDAEITNGLPGKNLLCATTLPVLKIQLLFSTPFVLGSQSARLQGRAHAGAAS